MRLDLRTCKAVRFLRNSDQATALAVLVAALEGELARQRDLLERAAEHPQMYRAQGSVAALRPLVDLLTDPDTTISRLEAKEHAK